MKRISPFYCGSQFTDWQTRNCDNCTKFDGDYPEKSKCDIDQALLEAYFEDGTVSGEMAKRMGHPDNVTIHTWGCPERDDRDDY